MNSTIANISLLFRALRFAADKHQNQRRKGGTASPYINHLIDVAVILWEIGGIRNFTTIAAGILHDTLEDTETSEEELRTEFGDEIYAIVLEVTDDKSLPDNMRKSRQIEHASHLSVRARQIKLADKISNISDVIDSPPVGWSLKRKRDYVAWGNEVIDRIRGTNERLEDYFDDLCEKARMKFEEEEKRIKE